MKNLNLLCLDRAFVFMQNYKIQKIYLALLFLYIDRAVLDIFVLHHEMTGLLSSYPLLLYMDD